jgi:hypothetical protein
MAVFMALFHLSGFQVADEHAHPLVERAGSEVEILDGLEFTREG